MADRRAQILEAAEGLLLHYGVQKTTVKDIAEEARVGVGTVYLEFGSKDDIIVELSRRKHERVLEAMRRAADGCEATDHGGRLEAMLRARVEIFVTLADSGAHATDLVQCCCPALQQAHQGFLQQQRALLEQILRQGQEAACFVASHDCGHLADALVAAFTTLAPPIVYQLEEEVLRRRLDALCALALQGLLSR